MDLLICNTCGVQYDTRARKSCKVCDDPRQFVPVEGQSCTTLRIMQESKKYTNVFNHDKYHSGIISISTEPHFAIGQRAFLLCSDAGNVLWDCITFIDDDTVARIKELGGLEAIVISHPHFYSTSLQWADAFKCKVYLSAEDQEWAMRSGEMHEFFKEQTLHLLDGAFQVIKVGGHFPGSSVLYWKDEKKLFTADSIMVVPSGVSHIDGLPNTASFTFMWSYPNMIPLPPNEVHKIWKAVAHLDFEDTHSAFKGRDTRGNSKPRVLLSAQIMVRSMGYLEHSIHQEAS